MNPETLRALANWFIQNYPYDNTAREIRAAADAWEADQLLLAQWHNEARLRKEENDRLRKRLEAAEKAIRLVPCLEKAEENGKGVVPVPEWVVWELHAALAGEEK